MDSCPLEISEMKEVVHFRFAFNAMDFLREIIDLDNDLSMSARFRITKIFRVQPRKSPGGLTEPV